MVCQGNQDSSGRSRAPSASAVWRKDFQQHANGLTNSARCLPVPAPQIPHRYRWPRHRRARPRPGRRGPMPMRVPSWQRNRRLGRERDEISTAIETASIAAKLRYSVRVTILAAVAWVGDASTCRIVGWTEPALLTGGTCRRKRPAESTPLKYSRLARCSSVPPEGGAN